MSKKTMKKLLEEYSNIIDILESMIEDITESNGEFVKDWIDSERENMELKEEIETLKNRPFIAEIKKSNEAIQREIEKLRERGAR